VAWLRTGFSAESAGKKRLPNTISDYSDPPTHASGLNRGRNEVSNFKKRWTSTIFGCPFEADFHR